MNPSDMVKEGLKQGDVVDLIGHYKGEKRYAHRFMPIPYDIPEGNTAAYFPETNVLVPLDSTADESNTPTSKAIMITIEKQEG
jgi:anaerobic selenocysteine-containing dehydrogenase